MRYCWAMATLRYTYWRSTFDLLVARVWDFGGVLDNVAPPLLPLMLETFVLLEEEHYRCVTWN